MTLYVYKGLSDEAKAVYKEAAIAAMRRPANMIPKTYGSQAARAYDAKYKEEQWGRLQKQWLREIDQSVESADASRRVYGEVFEKGVPREFDLNKFPKGRQREQAQAKLEAYLEQGILSVYEAPKEAPKPEEKPEEKRGPGRPPKDGR